MNMILLSPNISHDMKKIVFASPFFSQVILDFWLTLHFSMVAKPSNQFFLKL
jgi:hypothetical protein